MHHFLGPADSPLKMASQPSEPLITEFCHFQTHKKNKKLSLYNSHFASYRCDVAKITEPIKMPFGEIHVGPRNI